MPEPLLKLKRGTSDLVNNEQLSDGCILLDVSKSRIILEDLLAGRADPGFQLRVTRTVVHMVIGRKTAGFHQGEFHAAGKVHSLRRHA